MAAASLAPEILIIMQNFDVESLLDVRIVCRSWYAAAMYALGGIVGRFMGGTRFQQTQIRYTSIYVTSPPFALSCSPFDSSWAMAGSTRIKPLN